MPVRIAENELIDPALEYIYNSPTGTVTTTELRDHLLHVMRPKGEDTDILDGRNDMKFDQKVRNLKSHKTLEKTGYVDHVRNGFRLNSFGQKMMKKRYGP